MNNNMRVAVIHDWLTSMGGAEYTLQQILQLYPQADIYTIVDTLPAQERGWLDQHRIFTSPLQNYPDFIKRNYRHMIWRMPYWIEQFDLEAYDLIISDSHAVAKGVIVHPHQKHLAYIYSPMRYAWDLSYEHQRMGVFGKGLKKLFLHQWLHRFRIWDAASSIRPHRVVAISDFVSRRIKISWGRDADVIYPPVDLKSCPFVEEKEDYYITVSRLVPYKRVDLIIDAFKEMPHKKLIVVGDGPMMNTLRSRKLPNVTLTGYLKRDAMMELVSKARGFIFMPKEDFGIAPLEAQACGTPVIAYGRGGALETVRGIGNEKPTGIFVSEQCPVELCHTIEAFERQMPPFVAQDCYEWSQKFSAERFREEFHNEVKIMYGE